MVRIVFVAAVIGTLLGCSDLDDLAGALDVAETCHASSDCDDGLFCNGQEVCSTGLCIEGQAPCTAVNDCGESETCDDGNDVCVLPTSSDEDGDGHARIACGGDDCDDQDANNFPGNTEVCDALGLDEDCNPQTFGAQDLDGDGWSDATCCNVDSYGAWNCGQDCDDTNTAIVPGAVICDGQGYDLGAAALCADGLWEAAHCGEYEVCVTQPNDLGVCAPAS